MTQKIGTARSLLNLLKDAAETEDYGEAAAILKRMLQPWGLRLMQEHGIAPDKFDKSDCELLALFWINYFELVDSEDVLLCAASHYSLLSAASIEREYLTVIKAAQADCAFILEVIAKVEEGVEEQEPESSVVQFTRRPRVR